MGMKILAKEPVAETELAGVVTPEELVDRIGALVTEAEIAAGKIKKTAAQIKLEELNAEIDDLMGTLREMLDLGLKPNDDVTCTATHFQAKLGAMGKKRKLTNKAALASLLGEEQFFDLAEFKLGDLDKYLTEPQREQCITTTQTGERSLKVKPIED